MSFQTLNPGCPCDCDGCADTICVMAWFKPDPAPGGARTPIEGAEDTIERVYTDPVTHLDVIEAYTTCTTDADGTCCVPTPDPLADPTTAPTVDPIGGGTSGGVLAVGTYTAAYSYVTHYGETRLSPPSAEFQVGIPNAVSYPTLSPPTLHDTLLTAGGLLDVGTWYAVVVYTDGAGHMNLPTLESGFAFDVNALGDVPRITVPSLSLRPNAVDFSVYLSPDSDEGPFRLYQSGLTTTSIVPLTAAYNPAGAVRPSSNTSIRGIPGVTYTPGVGTVTDRVWALPRSSSIKVWVAATASPVDLASGLTAGTPQAANTTGHGRFKITCDPPLCASKTSTVTVGSACVNVGFDFGKKTIAFELAWRCCAPPSPQVELFDGATSLGTCVPVRLGDADPCLFDVSDLPEGTVLDWVFTDSEYPTQGGTVAVPECGDPDAVYVGTLRRGDVTVTTRLADIYGSLTLTLPTGAVVALAAAPDGSFVGDEVRQTGVDAFGNPRFTTYAWTFNDEDAPSFCNAGGFDDVACGLAVSWRCFDCASPAGDEVSGYVGRCSRQIRSDGFGGTIIFRTVSCFPLLYTWAEGSGTYMISE